jgi:hypothetical protein
VGTPEPAVAYHPGNVTALVQFPAVVRVLKFWEYEKLGVFMDTGFCAKEIITPVTTNVSMNKIFFITFSLNKCISGFN